MTLRGRQAGYLILCFACRTVPGTGNLLQTSITIFSFCVTGAYQEAGGDEERPGEGVHADEGHHHQALRGAGDGSSVSSPTVGT